MKKKLAFLFTILSLLLVVAACGTNEQAGTTESAEEKKVIKIGYLPITHAAPLFLQNEKEYEDYEIELVKFGSWPELMDALNTGRVDGASVLIQLAMKAKENGVDLKAVALGHRDGNVVVVSPEINSVQDLKGQTFAIPNRFSTHNVLLYQMLKKEEIQYEDVNVIELPPAEMPAALAEGRIAGYVVAEPFGAISVSLEKGKVLYQSEDIWENSIDCGLVLRGQFINENEEIAKKFVQDYVSGGELAQANDEYAHETIGNYINVEDEVLDLSLQWISYDDLNINEDAYSILTDALVEMNLSEAPPTYEDFVNTTLIEEE
ncbi:NitT/TauT family transport system substrate-binding protein OS=Ureibacillus acetophenoni OX=614649 GN=SAMN05877842_10859 PE=3 SV=1 [Ureibacillus acetophenoni]